MALRHDSRPGKQGRGVRLQILEKNKSWEYCPLVAESPRRKQQRIRKTTKEQPEKNKVNMEKLSHIEQEKVSQGKRLHHSQVLLKSSRQRNKNAPWISRREVTVNFQEFQYRLLKRKLHPVGLMRGHGEKPFLLEMLCTHAQGSEAVTDTGREPTVRIWKSRGRSFLSG